MRHRPSSESNRTPQPGTLPHNLRSLPSFALRRSGLCPAQVTHPELLTFILQRRRRLMGLGRTQEFRAATSATPAMLRFAHPSPSLPTAPRPAASTRGANFSTVSRETRGCWRPRGRRPPPGSVPARSGFGGWIRILPRGRWTGSQAASATPARLQSARAPPLAVLLPPAAPGPLRPPPEAQTREIPARPRLQCH